jgi:hypothetical protein
MSNGINAPYGLAVVQSQIGNGGTQKLGQYNIYADPNGQNTPATSIFKGDMVKYTPASTDFTTNGYGTIVAGLTPQVGAGAKVVVGLPVGIFMGCQYTSAQTGYQINSDYWPGGTQVKKGTSITAWVNDDPEVVFKMQISTSTDNTPVAAQNNVAPSIFQNIFRGQNAQVQVGGVVFTKPDNALPTQNPATGNTLTGQSAYYLDGSSITLAKANSGNSAFEIKIIGLAGTIQSLPNPTNLVPGTNMPFVDVLCKFNVHIHGSVGTPGVFFTT